MDEELKEALSTVETLMALLQLAWHDRGQTTAKEVSQGLKEGGRLLGRHGYPSDMAIRPSARKAS